MMVSVVTCVLLQKAGLWGGRGDNPWRTRYCWRGDLGTIWEGCPVTCM